MPNRFVSVVILVVWTYLTLALLRHDVLPGLLIGPPPDLRAVVRAEGPRASAVRWSILVADDAEDLDLRAVGQTRTESRRSSDGWVKLASRTWFDSSELLRGTPLGRGARSGSRSIAIST